MTALERLRFTIDRNSLETRGRAIYFHNVANKTKRVVKEVCQAGQESAELGIEKLQMCRHHFNSRPHCQVISAEVQV